MKQPIMCGNSADAVSTQKQLLQGKRSYGQGGEVVNQCGVFEGYTVNLCVHCG